MVAAALFLGASVIGAGLVGAGLAGDAFAARASATAAPPPHEAVAGFAAPDGDGFSLVFADGSVRPRPFGDAFALHLGDRVTGGSAVPTGDGYWVVDAAGNVFAYGTATALGGTGGYGINRPILGMASTPTGRGYWLTARDGGVFTFGDAVFHGSAAKSPLEQPIVGIAVSPIGKGYRLVARDGGVFTFGKVPFRGSLPSRHVKAKDVVGMATTPTGNGYWIVRSDGRVYAFGDAQPFGGVRPSSCDRIAGIIANPVAQGYRLVTESGRTIARGDAPGGDQPTGVRRSCGNATLRIELPRTSMLPGSSMIGHLVLDNETGGPLHLHTAGHCVPRWSVSLGNAQIPNSVVFPQACRKGVLTLPEGEHQLTFTIRARYLGTSTPLPPGDYFATFERSGGRFPAVAAVPVAVAAPA